MIPSDSRSTKLADAAFELLFGGDDDSRIAVAVASLDQLFRDVTGIREDTVDPRDQPDGLMGSQCRHECLLPTTARNHPLVLLVGSLCFYFFLLQLAWHGGPERGRVALFVECFLNGTLGQGENCESVLHAISPLRALRRLG